MTKRSEFRLTDVQAQATKLLGGPARSILLRGGSRSGKTFCLIRAVVVRALKAPGSRHGIFRHTLQSLKSSVVNDTFPKVMELCFKGVAYKIDRQNWVADFANGSSIIFGGLDDKQRTEKILGLEFATVYLNEASQISYGARMMLLTRLAQKIDRIDGQPLPMKEYIDANPPTTSHWLYALFEAGIEPKSGEPLANRSLFATMQLNPQSNAHNLAAGYLDSLESLSERERRRFLLGEYQSAVEGALWRLEMFRRAGPVSNTDLKRIVVAVDPSGCAGKEDRRSDEIGISVCGIDHRGIGHVLEDATLRGGPDEWARAAVAAHDRWGADRIIAERNFGGALVESNIRAARANVPVKLVTASRGKTARAEPVAALYEQGRVVHHGRFVDLEDQLTQFSAAGYQGAKSPDRADALVWALTELMLEQQVAPAQWVPTNFNLGR
ncbi:phage terminase large subunit [Tanticharoenia sakaeratensis]|uniref:Phage DNA packaging protein n=1 Tax=Tanticharoenia sakaeratensis NBRC 103193 TaxID=1231623 RepID=A0A0D6MNK4_9PROT|nr:phage terminase large subunit [Tanticharoenia sakaeratensis]GAN55244.1 phage DNA packaging protein [Tanticharoenia sakaeratensis NBRC 103193]GBQ23337.1 phage DNA packaging protein [Tanticharoenia sakaeratensis NBRC 103193]